MKSDNMKFNKEMTDKATDKEMEKLLEEFGAARSVESTAIKMLNESLESGGKDMELVLKETQEMLKAHNKSMEIYFKLLKYKLNGQSGN